MKQIGKTASVPFITFLQKKLKLDERVGDAQRIRVDPLAVHQFAGAPISSRSTGTIHADVAEKLGSEGPEGAHAIAALRALRMGEWWALTAMNKVDLNNPTSWPAPEKLLSLA